MDTTVMVNALQTYVRRSMEPFVERMKTLEDAQAQYAQTQAQSIEHTQAVFKALIDKLNNGA